MEKNYWNNFTAQQQELEQIYQEIKNSTNLNSTRNSKYNINYKGNATLSILLLHC
jgi:hypothetical protein